MSVSIPNGMEFYSESDKYYTYAIRFQFPTGWNSTLNTRSYMLHFFVSIPNGMEFYPYKKIQQSFYKHVSIPNGMEFYSTNFAIFLSRKC